MHGTDGEDGDWLREVEARIEEATPSNAEEEAEDEASGPARDGGERSEPAPGGDVEERETDAEVDVTPAEPDADAERSVAQRARRALLPRTAPRVEGYDVGGGTTTETGGRAGTVWDWVTLGSGRTALLTYEAQTNSIPPSHHLMAARVLFRALTADSDSIPDVLARANEAITRGAIGEHDLLQCAAVVIQPDGVEWACAGMARAGVIRREGTFEELASQGPPFGMMEGFRYGSRRVEMGPGDVLIVLSTASAGLFRGAADLVAQVHGKTAGETVETVHRAIRKAAGDGPAEETSVLFVRKH